MRYIDDILYLLGWACMIAFGFSFGWQAGLVVLAAAFWVTAVIFARSGARIMQKSRDEPRRSDG